MKECKIIYWDSREENKKDGKKSAYVHILQGYNTSSISDLTKMAEEIRRTFPEADCKDIIAGKITKSSRFLGCTIVMWSTHLPEAEYPGWHQKEYSEMEYKII